MRLSPNAIDEFLRVDLNHIDGAFLKSKVLVDPSLDGPAERRLVFETKLVLEQARAAEKNAHSTSAYVRLTKRITWATIVIALATVINVVLQGISIYRCSPR